MIYPTRDLDNIKPSCGPKNDKMPSGSKATRHTTRDASLLIGPACTLVGLIACATGWAMRRDNVVFVRNRPE